MIKMTPKIPVPIRYPVPFASDVVSPSHDMVTASPPVSPSVVARILTTQKRNVTSGTLATSSDLSSSILFSEKLSAIGFACSFMGRLLQRNREGQVGPRGRE